jgi:hypothetical protein
MQRARDRRVNDPAYIEWQKEHQAELDAEKAAQAVAAAQDPTVMYQQAANAEAGAQRDLVLNGVLSDEYLSQFGHIVREPFTEAQVSNAMEQFKAATPEYIQTRANAKVLIEFLYRNNISPAVCGSYKLADAIIRLWNGYSDEVAPQAEPEVAAEPVADSRTRLWSPSEQYKVAQANKDKVIGIVDGVKITEKVLDSLPSRDELLIRRKLEKGHAGDSNFDEYLERRDLKFAQDQEIAHKGEGGN